MARVALQGTVSNHPFQITINSLPDHRAMPCAKQPAKQRVAHAKINRLVTHRQGERRNDRRFQSWLKMFNRDRNFQSQSNISLLAVFLFTGPSWCYREGLDRIFNPRSIARNFQSQRPRSKFFNPRALWGGGLSLGGGGL